MGYRKRKQSSCDMYHVIVRGAGRQVIFESDSDRLMYLAGIKGLLGDFPVEILAWCLMGNHVHLVIHGDLEVIGIFMRDLGRFYAQYFNREHGRVGHLLQGRYRSVPIDSTEQLLCVARYVHQNPLRAGLTGSCAFTWSSYGEYLGEPGGQDIARTDEVLACFGDVDAFARFNEELVDGVDLPTRSKSVYRISDDAARDVLNQVLADGGFDAMPTDDRAARDGVLVRLKGRGISIRQIVRLTGVGRNIVARARG